MAQASRRYFITWEIELDAFSPEEAAKKALEIQRDPQSIATVFDVQWQADDLTPLTQTIDLTDYDGE
jgi:hypothetical protein